MDATKQVNRKHVMIALQRYEAGGAERQALYLAKGLMERGYPVTVMGFGAARGLAWQRFNEAGIKGIGTGFTEKLILKPNGLKGYYLQWKYQRRLIRLVQSLDVDILFSFTYAPNVIFGSLWKKMKVRCCYWNQRDEGIEFERSFLAEKALQDCTGILSNSEAGKVFLEQFTKRSIQIIHNGVEIPSHIRGIQTDKIKVVMLANLRSTKDHLTLLKAWKIVMDQLGDSFPVELILAGKDGDTTSALKAFADEHKLETVNFAGQVSNVHDLLANCSIGVFSSLKEGLPNGILECMAAGLAVVATKIEGAMESLGYEYEYFCEPNNENDLAAKLILFIKNNSLRETIGNRNKKRIHDLFLIDNMVIQYEEKINCK